MRSWFHNASIKTWFMQRTLYKMFHVGLDLRPECKTDVPCIIQLSCFYYGFDILAAQRDTTFHMRDERTQVLEKAKELF